MNKGRPQQYFPGFPKDFDPSVRKTIEHLWDRMNFLIVEHQKSQSETATKGIISAALAAKAKKGSVAIQAVADPQTQGGALVNFGPNTPIAASTTTVTAHTIILAPITGGGTTGSITWNSSGVIIAFVDPT